MDIDLYLHFSALLLYFTTLYTERCLLTFLSLKYNNEGKMEEQTGMDCCLLRLTEC